MGCFNGTCMISHLPIIYGEKIKLIFLHTPHGKANISGMSSYCYSNGILTPAFLAISGVYNDYGGIEKIVEDWNFKIIEETFKKRFGKKIIIDGEEKENYTLHDIIYGIERGDLQYFGVNPEDVRRKKMATDTIAVYGKHENKKFGGFSSKKTQDEWVALSEMGVEENWRQTGLCFVMIRQDIWDFSCTEGGKALYYSSNKKHPNVDEYGRIEAQHYFHDVFFREVNDEDVMSKTFRRKYNQIFNASYAGSGNYFDSEKYSELLFDAIENKYDELLILIFKEWSENSCVQAFIDCTRIGWMIQTGAGSQSTEWENHKKLAKKIVSVCDEHIKKENN